MTQPNEIEHEQYLIKKGRDDLIAKFHKAEDLAITQTQMLEDGPLKIASFFLEIPLLKKQRML